MLDSAALLLLATLAPEVRAHEVDLRPALMAAKRDRQVYSRTDSHWTGSGGWVGYREILALLAHDLQESLWVHGRDWDLAQLASASPSAVVDLIVEHSPPLLADASFLGAQVAVPAGPPGPTKWRRGLPPGFATARGRGRVVAWTR